MRLRTFRTDGCRRRPPHLRRRTFNKRTVQGQSFLSVGTLGIKRIGGLRPTFRDGSICHIPLQTGGLFSDVLIGVNAVSTLFEESTHLMFKIKGADSCFAENTKSSSAGATIRCLEKCYALPERQFTAQDKKTSSRHNSSSQIALKSLFLQCASFSSSCHKVKSPKKQNSFPKDALSQHTSC